MQSWPVCVETGHPISVLAMKRAVLVEQAPFRTFNPTGTYCKALRDSERMTTKTCLRGK